MSERESYILVKRVLSQGLQAYTKGGGKSKENTFVRYVTQTASCSNIIISTSIYRV